MKMILLLLSCCHVWLFCGSMDWNLPGSSVHRIFQARILDWVVISLVHGSYQHRDQTPISCIGRQILYHWTAREAWKMMYLYQLQPEEFWGVCLFLSVVVVVVFVVVVFCIFVCFIENISTENFFSKKYKTHTSTVSHSNFTDLQLLKGENVKLTKIPTVLPMEVALFCPAYFKQEIHFYPKLLP